MNIKIGQREEKIDFVIPWVDSNDPEWQAQRRQYFPGDLGDGRDIRYRDYETLRYWFRGVEKFAPWVNKIHFITHGHLPPWLNTAHPKLHIVRHEDYIPIEYLPTFSSHVIEINMHRIQGLADQFVYFNDDIFITRKIMPDDFFSNGIPKDLAALNIAILGESINSYATSNCVAIINKYFDRKRSIHENFIKWYNPLCGQYLVRTLLLTPWTKFPGMQTTHLTNAYLKSTFEEVWTVEREALLETTSRKFRDRRDLMQNVFKFWQLAQGNFKPRTKIGKYFNLATEANEANRAIRKQSYKIVCLNDHEEVADFEELAQRLQENFERTFPDMSAYEMSR